MTAIPGCNEPHTLIAVIYDKPLDYPRHFVVRIQSAGSGHVHVSDVIALTDTLEQARAHVPVQLDFPMTGDPDPHIVECWI